MNRPEKLAQIVAARTETFALDAAGLNAWRERLGLTQAGAAAALLVPKRTYEKYEAGQPVPVCIGLLAHLIERYGMWDLKLADLRLLRQLRKKP